MGRLYPFDDLTCWLSGASGVIHRSMLERHTEAADFEWRGTYMEYEPPQPGAVYVLGADPAGYGVRDHAAFQANLLLPPHRAVDIADHRSLHRLQSLLAFCRVRYSSTAEREVGAIDLGGRHVHGDF